MTLVSYRQRHRPPVRRVTDLGAQRATPHYRRIQVQRNSPERTGGFVTQSVPQQRGYNMAGISDETVSKGCQ